MKNEPQKPLHLGWLADAGAREAPLDAQGFLKGEPKRDSVPLTEYERLLQWFYDWARGELDTYEANPAAAKMWANAFEQSGFCDLAHQIREGMRDAKVGQDKDWLAGGHFRCDVHGVFEGGDCPYCPPESSTCCVDCNAPEGSFHEIGCSKVKENQSWEHLFSPQNPTTQAGYTEEEIAVVKNDGKRTSYPMLAKLYRDGPAYNGSEFSALGFKWERLAAIAEHLAKMEAE